MSQTFNVDCSTGQTSLVPYSAADTANQQNIAAQAQVQVQMQANASTIETNIQTHLAQIETWIGNNPTGAQLTNAQNLALAKMLVGCARLLLNLTSTVGQAT